MKEEMRDLKSQLSAAQVSQLAALQATARAAKEAATPLDTAPEPRFGHKVSMHTKAGEAKVPVCGNNGVTPRRILTSWDYAYDQQRAEKVILTDHKPDRTSGLPEEQRLELDGTVRFVRWQTKIVELLVERGLDVCLWVCPDEYDVVLEYKHVLDDFHDLKRENVTKWVKVLLEDGTLASTHKVCPYDVNNMKWSGETVLNSIGPKLLEKISYGGAADYSGLEALYLIKEATETNRVTKIEGLKRDLRKVSLKDSPTANAEEVCDKLTSIVNQLQVEDSNCIVGGNLGKDVAQALYVDSEFSKTLDLGIQALVSDFYMTTLRSELDHAKLKDRLSEIALRHRTLVGQDAYAPAKNQPNKQAQQLQSLTAQVNQLKKSITGSNGSQKPNGNENPNGSKKDKSNITCHGCGKKGHYKNDPECELNRNGNEEKPPKDTSWKKIAPKAGEPKKKEVGKNTFYWCSKCGDGGMWRVSHGDTHPDTKHQSDYKPPSKQDENGDTANLGMMSAGFELTDEGGVPGGLYFASSTGSELGWTTVTARKKRGQKQSQLPKAPGRHDL